MPQYDIGFSFSSMLNKAFNPLEHLKMVNSGAQKVLALPGKAVGVALNAPQYLVNRALGRRPMPARAALPPPGQPSGDPSSPNYDPMLDPTFMAQMNAQDASMPMDPGMDPYGYGDPNYGVADPYGAAPPAYDPYTGQPYGVAPYPGAPGYPAPGAAPAPGQPFVPTGPGVVKISGCAYDIGLSLDSLKRVQDIAVKILKDPLTRTVAKNLAMRNPYGRAAVAIVDALPQAQALAKMALANAISDPKIANAAAALAEAKTGEPAAVVKLALLKKAADMGHKDAVETMARVEQVNQATEQFVGTPVEENPVPPSALAVCMAMDRGEIPYDNMDVDAMTVDPDLMEEADSYGMYDLNGDALVGDALVGDALVGCNQ